MGARAASRRMRGRHRWGVWPILIGWIGLVGCSAVGAARSTEPASTSSPVFALPPHDAASYRELARKQDVALAACNKEEQGCERVHYTRALLALYADREEAARHFQDVIALAPDDPLAASSRVWLDLLRRPRSASDGETFFPRGAEHLVRDAIEREILIQALQADLRVSAVEALKRQLKARDKRVEELTGQIEALRRIEQDVRNKNKAMRLLPGSVPAPGDDRRP